jgi:FkbM family methyltransferase
MSQRLVQTYYVLKSEGIKSTVSKVYRYLGMKLLGVDFYNKPIVDCIRRQSSKKKYSTFVDVGAHVGIISASVGKLFQSFIVVEPAEKNFSKLQENVRRSLGDKCKLFPVALGKTEGQVILFESATNTGDKSISNRADLLPGSLVSMTTLDALIEKAGVIAPFFIKVDVQGNELSVFEGAEKTLAKDCAIISEFWPWGLKSASYDPLAYVEFMKAHGYVCHNLGGERLSRNWLERFSNLGETNQYVTTDLFFLKI